MPIIEITDKDRVAALLEHDPLRHLEAIDENALGVDGIVSVFCEDVPVPPSRLVVRWAQGSLGLRSILHVDAGTLSGLSDVVDALPDERAQYDALVPFFASPALGASFQSEVMGASALYTLDPQRLVASPVVQHAQRVTDMELVKPMFRKLADDAPAYALPLRNQIAAVAVVTHLRSSVARVQVYTVEEARKRGFGRGVLTALCEELLAMHITPTARVELSDEPSVRLVEGIGFTIADAQLSARLTRRSSVGGAGGLVQLGGR